MAASTIPVETTLGAVFFAVTSSAVVYGANVWQAAYYYKKYSRHDSKPLVLFVSALLIMDTASLALASHTLYIVCVTNFDDAFGDLFIPWSHGAFGFIVATMNTLTYNFLAHRIYCVSGGKMHIPLSIVVASLGSLGSGLAYSADNLKYRLVDQTMFSNSNAISFFAFQMACDILITAGMVYYLYQCRGLIKRTNSVINILAFYSVNCGAINMICVAASLACIIASPRTLIWTVFLVNQAKLYCCSFMAILNSRERFREMLHSADGVVVFTSLHVTVDSTA